MVIDGTWNLKLQTPMGERSVVLRLAAAGATLTYTTCIHASLRRASMNMRQFTFCGAVARQKQNCVWVAVQSHSLPASHVTTNL